MGIGAMFLMGKTKYAFAALKLTKAAPLASMVLSSFAYSFIFGWPYAVGMVGLIVCHECGHALVMNHYKVPFSPMVLIPFMGAVIAMKETPRSVYENAMIAFGGPVLGSCGALCLGLGGMATDSQLLLALADFGYMINLFNLMPIGALDGGKIGEAIHPYVGVAGVAGGASLIYLGATSSPIFYLVMITGIYSTGSRLLSYHRLFGFEEEQSLDFYKISRRSQAGISLGYVGLISALLFAMNENNKYRKTPKELRVEEKMSDEWGIESFFDDKEEEE